MRDENRAEVHIGVSIEDFHFQQIARENFPTLAIYRGDALLHFGVSLPQQGTVARLVDEMTNRSAGGSDAPDAVVKLPLTLRRRLA